MCFHGVQSHNFTFFHHSYTCGTDWPLTCLTGSMGPALSGLSPRSAFPFILCRVGALFRDWMPIGINFNAVWHLFFQILARKTGVCLSARGTSRIQLFNWRYSQDIRQSCKTRMIHTYSRRRFGTAAPRKQQIVNFQVFSDQNCPANRAQKPAIRTQKPTNGRKSGFLPWCVLTKCILSQQS